jgi:hypothetical protein
MKIIGMAVEDDMSRVPAVVAVILAVQRLMKVSHEVDYELQRFHLNFADVSIPIIGTNEVLKEVLTSSGLSFTVDESSSSQRCGAGEAIGRTAGGNFPFRLPGLTPGSAVYALERRPR